MGNVTFGCREERDWGGRDVEAAHHKHVDHGLSGLAGREAQTLLGEARERTRAELFRDGMYAPAFDGRLVAAYYGMVVLVKLDSTYGPTPNVMMAPYV